MDCKRDFEANSNAQKYCKRCYKRHRKKKDAEYYDKRQPERVFIRNKRRLTTGYQTPRLGAKFSNPCDVNVSYVLDENGEVSHMIMDMVIDDNNTVTWTHCISEERIDEYNKKFSITDKKKRKQQE